MSPHSSLITLMAHWAAACQDHRPQHVHCRLEDRITPACLQKLQKIRDDIEFEMQTALGHLDERQSRLFCLASSDSSQIT